MLKSVAFANAVAAIMAVWVVACALLSYLVPNLLFTVAQLWMHTINLNVVKTTFTPNLGSIVLSLVSATGLAWITTYATIGLYNRWANK